jgi:hypothetical protein
VTHRWAKPDSGPNNDRGLNPVWWRIIPKNEGGMGFRDLHSFNLAMLAKQVWRLIDASNSLCARILRAKYYPDGDILKAGPKAGSSFTWQSIVAGIETFKRGCIWRVGNGDSIQIWKDPWIPSSPDWKIVSPRGACILTKVAELIDPISGRWDEEIIQSNFHPIDVQRILQIPLHINAFSAYHVEWKHQFNGFTCRSLITSTSLNNPTWKILWKLDVPAKVKIYCWRIMHGVLPLKSILLKRHIGTTSTCPICNSEEEDVMHMVFKCPGAANIWRGLGLKITLLRRW